MPCLCWCRSRTAGPQRAVWLRVEALGHPEGRGAPGAPGRGMLADHPTTLESVGRYRNCAIA